MGDNAIVERFVLPTFAFVVSYVGADKKLDEYDRALADVKDGDVTLFRVGFHAPIGSMKKFKGYDTASSDSVVWVKRIADNRLEIVFGDDDPADGVSYAKEVETLVLPF